MPIKEALFWFGITIFGTGLFFMVEGGERMPFALLLTLIGFMALAYSVYAHYKPGTPNVPVWIGLLIITWAALLFDIYDRHSTRSMWYDPPNNLETIMLKNFVNEDIELDGKRFDECTFQNVTFVFRGIKPFVITHNHIDGGGHPIQIKIKKGPQFMGATLASATVRAACQSQQIPCPAWNLIPMD